MKRCCEESFRLGIEERERGLESDDEERGEQQQLINEEEPAPAACIQ